MTALDATSSIGAASSRLTRVLFSGAALTGIALVALAGASVAEQTQVSALWWTLAFAIPLLVMPLAMLVLAWTLPVLPLRVIGSAFAIYYVLALTSFPAAALEVPLPGGAQPWMIDLLPMVSLMAAIVLRPTLAWGFLLLICTEAGIVRYLTNGASDPSMALQDSLYNATTVAVFVAIVMATLRAARDRDETAERTAADAVLLASAEAEYLQRAQVSAMLHDEVLSTLIAAVRSTPASAPLIQASARRALDRIDSLSADEVAGASCTLDALVAAVRDTVMSIAPDSTLLAPAAGETRVPLAVERAIVGATAEALRNSVRHSPAEATRRKVTVVATRDEVTVTVADDGPGFDPATVPAERFGVRFSIVRRMELLEGGSARLFSTPERGTRVELRWRRVGA